jgi:hypothetical protein
MYRLYSQHLDLASGFHVMELRDERGHRHLLQLAVAHTACPACGAVQPKDNLDALDPVAAVAQVNEALNTSQRQMLAYAAKHRLAIR